MSFPNIEQHISNTANWVNLQLKDISNIASAEFRKILYYSLIDAFVQSYNNYPRFGEKKAFSDFLLTFHLNTNQY